MKNAKIGTRAFYTSYSPSGRGYSDFKLPCTIVCLPPGDYRPYHIAILVDGESKIRIVDGGEVWGA